MILFGSGKQYSKTNQLPLQKYSDNGYDSLSEKIIVMEIIQLFNTLGKPGCSYNCKTWVAEGFGFLDGQVSRLKLSTFCDERELKLEMLELDWQFPQSCTDVAGHVSQFLVALLCRKAIMFRHFLADILAEKKNFFSSRVHWPYLNLSQLGYSQAAQASRLFVGVTL